MKIRFIKKIRQHLALLLSLTMLTGLALHNNNGNQTDQYSPFISRQENHNPPMASNKAKIIVGSTSFTVTLQDNATTKAFKGMLPITINMSELHNNEKYSALPRALPAHSSNPGTIQNGDLMLYGSDTLVLFYKTFSTPYRYTRIGRVDNPTGLQDALGSGKIMVTIEIQE